jgi:hypothetical protein
MTQIGENFRVREVMTRESSVVFSLALNFMELLLLADFSMIYESEIGAINFSKLTNACEDIHEQYGPEIESMLTNMLNE